MTVGGVLGVADTYEACRTGAVARRATCDVVRVVGPDALSYLQSQCTQDVAALAVGASAYSLLLSPQGHVEAFVRVVRVEPEELVVVVAAGFGDAVVERLRRFKLRVKAELVRDTWPLVEVRGPDARSEAARGAGTGVVASLDVDWPGATGVDLVGPGASVPGEVPVGDDRAFEAVRVESGEPVMGAEIAGRTIAQEAGLVERSVSLTKGCYPGQELVARVDSRGDNVPRRLRGIVVADGAAPSEERAVLPGASVVVAGEPLGTVTSAAWSPGRGRTVALSYVHRRAVPPVEATVEGKAGELLRCTVVELPLVVG
ncbi:MAG: hypothetical protein M0Z33_00730 [Actinomycetota bacterium]|nr:hypothetical protein [Actinomycetota bacterium]